MEELAPPSAGITRHSHPPCRPQGRCKRPGSNVRCAELPGLLVGHLPQQVRRPNMHGIAPVAAMANGGHRKASDVDGWPLRPQAKLVGKHQGQPAGNSRDQVGVAQHRERGQKERHGHGDASFKGKASQRIVDDTDQIAARGDKKMLRGGVGLRRHRRIENRVIMARNDAVGLDKERFTDERVRRLAKQADGKIDPVLAQGAKRLRPAQRLGHQPQPWRKPPHLCCKKRHQRCKLIVECSQPENALGRCRVELLGAAQGLVERLDNRSDLWLQGDGNGCRLQPERPAQKKLVPEHIAQSFERVADGGLREPHLICDTHRLPMAHEPQEDQQDGEVKPPQFNLIDIGHEPKSFSLLLDRCYALRERNGSGAGTMTANIDTYGEKRVLMIVANPSTSPVTGWPVGFWWSEVTHPYWSFSEAGYKVDIVSPKGGDLAADGFSDPEDDSQYSAFDILSLGFKHSQTHAALLKGTQSISNVNIADYDAIFVAGGQSPMITMVDDTDLHTFVAGAYEADKIVAIVCHGTSILLKTKLSNGKLLVDGKTWTGFANAEEQYADNFVGQKIQPFWIEDEARKLDNTTFITGGLFKPFAVRDGNLITGQQQFSGAAAAQLVIEALGR